MKKLDNPVFPERNVEHSKKDNKDIVTFRTNIVLSAVLNDEVIVYTFPVIKSFLNNQGTDMVKYFEEECAIHLLMHKYSEKLQELDGKPYHTELYRFPLPLHLKEYYEKLKLRGEINGNS